MRLIRSVVPGEADLLAEHYLALEPRDRRLRFCSAMSDAAVRAYCAGLDWERTAVLGCFEDGRLVGALQLDRIEGGGDTLEFSISILDGWRGRGIAGELGARARMAAAICGKTRLAFRCLPENEAMMRLALRLNGHWREADGEVVGEVPVWLPSRRPVPLEEATRACDAPAA